MSRLVCGFMFSYRPGLVLVAFCTLLIGDSTVFEPKENTALLIKQRLPPRPCLNPTAKALIAQQQNWMCCNPEGDWSILYYHNS